MSTFLIPSPSLPHPRSLKIAALLNRLSLSFICHSSHRAPLSQSLCVFYLFSLLPPPQHTLALHASVHCSAVIFLPILSSSIYTHHILFSTENQCRKKERLLISLLSMLLAHSVLPHLSLCSLSTSLPPYVLPPSLSLSPCSLHLFQTQGSYI